MDWIPTVSEWHGPMFLRIVDALAADIASGRLVRGQRLPTHRALASALAYGDGTGCPNSLAGDNKEKVCAFVDSGAHDGAWFQADDLLGGDFEGEGLERPFNIHAGKTRTQNLPCRRVLHPLTVLPH